MVLRNRPLPNACTISIIFPEVITLRRALPLKLPLNPSYKQELPFQNVTVSCRKSSPPTLSLDYFSLKKFSSPCTPINIAFHLSLYYHIQPKFLFLQFDCLSIFPSKYGKGDEFICSVSESKDVILKKKFFQISDSWKREKQAFWSLSF